LYLTNTYPNRSAAANLGCSPYMFYKASLDTTTKVMSAFVAVLFVFLGNQSVTEIIASNDDLSTLLLHTWILLVMLTTFVGAYLFSVRGYLIKGDTLII